MERRRPWGFYLTLVAVAWSAFILSAALWFPAYASDPPEPASARTLLAVNGPGVLLVMAIPLVLALVAWIGLHAKCARGSRAGENVAVGATIVMVLLGLVGAASVGLFVLPAALVLVLASVVTPAP